MHRTHFGTRLPVTFAIWLVYACTCYAAKTSSANLTSTVTNPSTSVTPTTLASSILTSFPPASTQSSNVSVSNPASLVNLFIGTTNGGHVFPGKCAATESSMHILIRSLHLGATLPHGMAKVGMDTDSPGNVSCSSLTQDCLVIH